MMVAKSQSLSFIIINNFPIKTLSGNYASIAISSTGQYQVCCHNTTASNTINLFISNNFGLSWNLVSNLTDDWQSVSISSTGQYQTAALSGTNGLIYVSNDFGVTWNFIS